MPPQGGGLYEYSTSLPESWISKNLDKPPSEDTLKHLNPRVLLYQPGWIYFHSGNIPHSIIRFRNYNFPRVTLQCHGILEKDTDSIYLYF